MDTETIIVSPPLVKVGTCENETTDMLTISVDGEQEAAVEELRAAVAGALKLGSQEKPKKQTKERGFLCHITCEFECASADLYFDHLLFDTRHFELAQKEAEDNLKLKQNRRSRSFKRSSFISS
ncbi:hypothetical protein EDC05_003637 [Coemansia umbellata]|uniref:Uncharacterized protein n=1 Tax=Coemansia umbellata TaxID=1424467 RepID=A0ABQ8PLA7_9FUNG|nr:hypothetical protein EDC05_003637 [Coemansia umbellata]